MKTRRLHVAMEERDYEVLKAIAARRGTNVSEVVRLGLRLGTWYLREIEGTSKTLQVRDGSTVTDLTLIR